MKVKFWEKAGRFWARWNPDGGGDDKAVWIASSLGCSIAVADIQAAFETYILNMVVE